MKAASSNKLYALENNNYLCKQSIVKDGYKNVQVVTGSKLFSYYNFSTLNEPITPLRWLLTSSFHPFPRNRLAVKFASYHNYHNPIIIKIGITELIFSCKRLKLKLRVFLAGCVVTMVTYYVT